MENLTVKEIAEKYGLTERKVRLYLKKVGLKSTSRPAMYSVRDVERKLAAINYQVADIKDLADNFDISEKTVRRLLKNFGLKPVTRQGRNYYDYDTFKKAYLSL